MLFARRLRFVALLLACSIASSLFAAWPGDYDQRYVDAVNETQLPLTADRVSTSLTTIGNSDHIRNATNQVLMTTFANYTGYDRSYNQVPSRTVFCAVAPELYDFHQTNHTTAANMSLRTKQLLGLPQDHTGYFVAEFWANNASLFRPAMNADITDPVTSLSFVGAMADPASYQRIWFDDWYSRAYDPTKTMPPYPWTRAGYTYDWGITTAPNIGSTEFIFNNTHVTDVLTVRAVIAITSYKYYQRATESFDVTSWCDTIWLGTKYLPVVAGGNWVDIYPGVTISGGEGIAVTDLAGQNSSVSILNAGTIQGLARNHDGTLRDSSVWFTNTGGTLTNLGTITGDRIGVLGSETSARPIVIYNQGTISGTELAIRTGGGDDTINVLGGAIYGSIDGGTGTNTLNFSLQNGVTFVFDDDVLNVDNVNVISGTTQLNGAVSGEVVVTSGATLGGNCSLSGNLVNAGDVAPGNSIGAINVGGNYTQTASGQLDIEVGRTSGGLPVNDELIITGTATLAADSQIDVSLASGSESVFRTGDTFEIITAGGGLSDLGADVTCDSAFLDFVGSAGADDYTLTLTRAATFQSVATPGNNARMAAALDADANAAVDGYAGLINQLLFTNASTFNNSLPQFSPAPYLAVSAASNRTTQYMAEAWGGYLRMRRAGRTNMVPTYASSQQRADAFAQAVDGPTGSAGAIKYCSDERTIVRGQNIEPTRSVWVNPFGVFYGDRSRGDHLGFQSDVAGVQFGVDTQCDENCILGIGGGYDQMHISTAGPYSVGDTETFRVGPYLTWYNGEWYLDSSLTGGFHSNDLARHVDVDNEAYSARGIYHANDLSMYLGGGRDIRAADCTVSPLASLQWIGYRQKGFTESGADGANLVVDPLDAQSLRSRLGGQVMRVYCWHDAKIVPEVFCGWAHECLANDNLEARFLGGVAPFSTDRGGIFRDSGYYGITLTAIPARDRASFFARYNGEYSSGGHFTAVDLGLMFEF
jgi:uncharacterized protein with beta-barrel porin domain